jgi:hypothetical protein
MRRRPFFPGWLQRRFSIPGRGICLTSNGDEDMEGCEDRGEIDVFKQEIRAERRR